MKVSAFAVLALFAVPLDLAHAADAAAVDAAARNEAFAPAAGVTPAKSQPAVNAPVQDRRFEAPTIDKASAAIGDRRAAIDVHEARDKTIRDKQSQKPAAVTEPTSDLSRRLAPISTGGNTVKPPLVSKFQDGLTAASASNMARFPAAGRATTAKVNRFVFRRSNGEPAVAAPDGRPAVVTPAGGGTP